MKNLKEFVLGNGIVTDGKNVFIENGAVFIKDGKIEKVGPLASLKSESTNFIDVKGRIIMPGLLNPHHHLYSFLATGLSPLGTTNNFVEILENLWWKLDYVLDKDSIYYSALMGVIDSIKSGVTTIFDHHASMGHVRGSLSLIEEAFNVCDLKGVLCFETSDRHGPEEFSEHINENLEFAESHKDNENIKGIFGLHANLTLSDKSLKKISEIKPKKLPIHIHLGEDRADLEFVMNTSFRGPLERLLQYDLLAPNSILAHAIHLTDKDYKIIEECDLVVVTNPESNANNRVGKMNREKLSGYVLGTDGMSGDMITSLRSYYLLGEGVKESFANTSKMFFENQYKALKKYFPTTGSLEAGFSADIAVLDYIPLTPINLNNLLGHFLFGLKTGKIFMTISNGKILYKEGKLIVIDEEKVIKEAQKVAKRLHEKYYSQKN